MSVNAPSRVTSTWRGSSTVDKWDGYEKRVGLVNARAEIRMCACGVDIVVTHSREHDLQAALLTHQKLLQHQAWRRRQGIR